MPHWYDTQVLHDEGLLGLAAEAEHKLASL